MSTEEPIVIGMLVGETSGDMLGASLMRELRSRNSNIRFVGIGGPLMIAQGFESLFDMERLSVMGFVEPMKRLPELLKIRASVVKYFRKNKPAVFIGIDAPDFNLGVEKRLKKSGIKTVHYVSPSVWAWRQGRIDKIRAAVDHMLCLLPFEAEFYQEHGVPVSFVGHPMADEIPIDVDKLAAKRRLGVPENALTLAILPGSRKSELALLARLFLRVAKQLQRDKVCVDEIVVAAATEEGYRSIKLIADDLGVKVRLFHRQARDVLAAADVGLVASGTVTLEAMLLKTPIVVAYRLEKFSYWVAKKLVKTEHIALPNLLANERVVPEYVQKDATNYALSQDLSDLLATPSRRLGISNRFYELHRTIRLNASVKAADVICAQFEESDSENRGEDEIRDAIESEVTDEPNETQLESHDESSPSGR